MLEWLIGVAVLLSIAAVLLGIAKKLTTPYKGE